MNRSNSLLRLSMAAALAIAAGTAVAQTTPPTDAPVQKQEPMTPPAHSQADSQNAVMQARFDALDKNHDGFLSKDEVGKDRGRLIAAMDRVNTRYGRGTMLMASAGIKGDRRTWSMRQERRTPHYTTRWEDMPVARA